MKIKNEILKKMIDGAIVALLPCVTLLILGPLEVYKTNINEIDFGAGDFIFKFIIATIGLCIFEALIMLIPYIRDVSLVVLFTGGIGSYVQILFLNGYLGKSDGRQIIWRENTRVVLINGAIWGVILIVSAFIAIYKRKKYRKIYVTISAFLIAIQLLAVVSILASTGIKHLPDKMAALDTADINKIGEDDNIVLFVLDGFSNWDFENLLKDKPETEDIFKDFVYYDNECSIYGATFPSLLHMITGTDPTFEGSCREWKENAWYSETCESFYEEMHDAGYSCELYTTNEIAILGNISNAANVMDNVTETTASLNEEQLIRSMIMMSFYRGAPYWYKDVFEVYSDPFSYCVTLSADNTKHFNSDFYNQLKEEGLSTVEGKTYKIIHLYGTHPPYRNNALCEYDDGATRENVREGLAYMLEEYFAQMKQIGVYDNSTIIVTADHGAQYILTDEFKNQPTFLYKGKGEVCTKMQINSAPISHDDIIPTVLQAAGIEHGKFGTSILEWHEDDSRERTYIEHSEMMLYSFDGDRYDLLESKEKNGGIYINPPSEWR